MQHRSPQTQPRPGGNGMPGDAHRTRRIIGVMVSVGALTVLAIAARLAPSSTGAGTHVQLGLFQCGWLSAFGKPCPTCGMTTAFAHAAHAQLPQAFLAQPLGALLALATSAAFWAGLHVAFTGSDLGRVGSNLLRPRVLWTLAAAAAAAWAYKLLVWQQP